MSEEKVFELYLKENKKYSDFLDKKIKEINEKLKKKMRRNKEND